MLIELFGVGATLVCGYACFRREEPPFEISKTVQPAVSADARGALGEALVSGELRRVLTRLCGNNYQLLDSLILIHKPGTAFPTAEIDHLAVTPFGIFVIETKHWSGVVTRGDSDDTLRLTMPDGQCLVRTSPLKQNAAKVRFVRSLLPPRLWAVEGLGVFSNPAARIDPALPMALLECSELYRLLRVRQQQFGLRGVGRLPVRVIAEAILRCADTRPEAGIDHRERIRADSCEIKE
ncbi:nuclease-related domain-containing protein [Paraburkholderia sediminicola]|uniref:nuclease-related domain-containing protein n=1 Tax=Paraburkholderia sediminicola TaxID=458836 RepID=UPI0038B8560A